VQLLRPGRDKPLAQSIKSNSPSSKAPRTSFPRKRESRQAPTPLRYPCVFTTLPRACNPASRYSLRLPAPFPSRHKTSAVRVHTSACSSAFFAPKHNGCQRVGRAVPANHCCAIPVIGGCLFFSSPRPPRLRGEHCRPVKIGKLGKLPSCALLKTTPQNHPKTASVWPQNVPLSTQNSSVCPNFFPLFAGR